LPSSSVDSAASTATGGGAGAGLPGPVLDQVLA
jgi:hypothetical protein